MGISSKASTDVPRSIVLHLESEIARLETELMQDGRLELVNASDILLQMPASRQLRDLHGPGHDDQPTPVPLPVPGPGGAYSSHDQVPEDSDGSLPGPGHVGVSILSSRPLQAVVSATLPCGSGATDLLSRVRMGLTPSSARAGERSRTAALSPPRSNKGSSFLSASILSSMPADIVERLVKKYLSTVHLDNPFLVSCTVLAQFRNVARVLGWHAELEATVQNPTPGGEGELRPHVVASHDFLVIYLVLAISVTLGSANGGHEEQCMALSVSLFEEGIQHLYSLTSFPSDIAWLQTVLLLLLYATVFPRSANVWVLSGVAMRSCLELGLHREPPGFMVLDATTSDLGRRVFWSAYCMDRSICSALQRPLSTPDTAINTRFPALSSQDEDGSENFLGAITYHQLLSEMLHVHFQREDIAPGLTWDDWLASMELRLRAWRNTSTANLPPTNNVEFTMARGLMLLHRPSPRVPLPPPRSLLVAFEAACTSARVHSQHVAAGFFRRPWLSAHYTLEAATVVLFCLRHGSAAIMERFAASQIFDMTKTFTTNFLTIASQNQGGWPEISTYAGVYERLLGPLLERVFLKSEVLHSGRFGPAEDAELMRLLYPGPAHLEKLRFGLRRREEEQEEVVMGEDLGSFDFNLFMIDDEFDIDGPMDAVMDD